MPWEFWRLTPRELILQMRGFEFRQEQENWRMANIVATLMNPIMTLDADPKKAKRSRKRITAADVLGKTPDKPKATMPEDQLKLLRRLTKGLGGSIKTNPRRSPENSAPLHHGHRSHQD